MTSTDSDSSARPPAEAPGSAAPSGVDLARVALQAAKAAARRRGDQPGAGKPRRARGGRTARGDGREPRGLADVLQQLIAERAWEVPAAGGSVLQQWPDVAPDLAPHVRAVGFDADTGRLDLLPDSPAYATQLRMSTARLIGMANQAAGRDVVRSIRVLPPGTKASAPASPTQPSPAPEPAGPVHTRETASAGYRQALATHQASKPKRGDPLAPAVRTAVERQDQVLRARRESEDAFADARELAEQLGNRARAAADPEARALARARAEKAGLPVPAAQPATRHAQAG